MKKALIFFLSIFFFIGVNNANNIQISNVGITGQNTTLNYSFVKFDLSWENSWRISVGPSNWDAAWIFIKFRVNNGPWTHANVYGLASGYTVPADVTVSPALEGLYGVGAFLHRSTDGSGNVNWQNIQVRWNYGTNGVGDNDLVDVQVFAVEMVYVPQGAFFVGGANGTEVGKFYTYPTTSNSYSISSEGQIIVGTGTDNLYYDGGSGTGDKLGPVPPAFPKGFNAFYCMKYEVSQDQWVSFFNTLTNTQKLNRDITDATHKNSDAEVFRNTVAWNGSGNATTTTPNRPVNWVNWEDCNAYLDWAALRPMTELEFEKAIRGPLAVVANEYAWGNANIHGTAYSLTGDGTPNENITNPGIGSGNAMYSTTNGSIDGPLRCGIFAANAVNKNREETGGSYYGIMELSGNLSERTVTLGKPEGRAFTGLHGNGVLNSSGDGNVANWLTIAGAGFRGGEWNASPNSIRVSDRTIVASNLIGADGFMGAARGVRSTN